MNTRKNTGLCDVVNMAFERDGSLVVSRCGRLETARSGLEIHCHFNLLRLPDDSQGRQARNDKFASAELQKPEK